MINDRFYYSPIFVISKIKLSTYFIIEKILTYIKSDIDKFSSELQLYNIQKIMN